MVWTVCVSLGSDGALLTRPKDSLYASTAKVEVQSTVGAGDSMVAGLLAGFVQGISSADTLRPAVACSSGTIQQPGRELFVLGMIKEPSAGIQIRALGI